MNTSVNISSIKKKAMASKKIEKKADEIVQKNLNNASSIFLEEFDDHSITQEIENGPEASNSSGTLSGKGNLFSFIGFNKGDAPISSLRLFLAKGFSYKKIKKQSNSFLYKINYPNIDKIKSITPMPWEGGRSWVDGVEKGISGLSQYIYKKFAAASRSGSGIQSRNFSKGYNFKPKKYLSEIIENFKNRL